MTVPHKRLIKVVEELRLSHLEEAEFGKYFIDVYLPEFHIGLEADGPHHLQKADAIRDSNLMEAYGLPLLHIHHIDLGTVGKREMVKERIIEFIEIWHPTIKQRINKRSAIPD